MTDIKYSNIKKIERKKTHFKKTSEKIYKAINFCYMFYKICSLVVHGRIKSAKSSNADTTTSTTE